MTTSRISKLLRETSGVPLFRDAQALRARDVVLFVNECSSPLLVRSAVALTLRCFEGRTIVRGVDGAVPAPIASEVEQEAASYGAFSRLAIGADGEGLQLGLGCSCDGVFVDAHGWSVSVNQLGPARAATAAPAAGFAAAAGVAKLFATVLQRKEAVLREAWSAPLLDLAAGEDVSAGAAIELGRVVLIGAGAIGSGLAHVLHHSGWSGEVMIVDDQRYDEPNHETTLLISQQMAMRQVPKAVNLARLCQSEGISTEGRQERIITGHPLLTQPADALVCAVDNVEARRCLDEAAAPVVFNAGVGGSREDAGHVLWTRHDAQSPSLSSYYPVVVTGLEAETVGPQDIVTDACSRVAYANVSLAAPFMGLAAGALLAAGLAQHALGLAAPTTYFKLDLLGLQHWSTRQALRRSTRAA